MEKMNDQPDWNEVLKTLYTLYLEQKGIEAEIEILEEVRSDDIYFNGDSFCNSIHIVGDDNFDSYSRTSSKSDAGTDHATRGGFYGENKKHCE